MKIAVVKWGDAWIDFQDISLEDASELQPLVRYTAGFFIKETDDAIILCTDYYEVGKGLNAPMVIPKGMVMEIYFINKGDEENEDTTH
jgi:hypothetical protein